MAFWTPEEQLTFDIAFAIKKVTIPGFRKAVKEDDRLAIAKTVVATRRAKCGPDWSQIPRGSLD
jgi:hypothetical protein